MPTSEDTTAIVQTNAPRLIYVNDAAVNHSGDWTTAPGDDANDGLTPQTPMASVEAVLQSYDVGPDDVILVDAGIYDLNATILLEAANSGVTIRGYADDFHADRAAVFDRGSTSLQNSVIELAGAVDVTIENLTLTGAGYGIYAGYGAGSNGLTVRGTTITGIGATGLRLYHGNDHAIVADNIVESDPLTSTRETSGIVIDAADATVIGNTVRGHTGAGIFISAKGLVAHNWVYENTHGISALGSDIAVHDNTVHGSAVGIRGTATSVITDNRVFDNRENGITSDGQIRGNVVHSSPIAIIGAGQIAGNRVFNNTTGILSRSALGPGTEITRNQVYSNALGIEIAMGRVEGNLVYANRQAGMRLTSRDVQVLSNTVYQIVGNAVEIRGPDMHLANNILAAHSGYVMHITSQGTPGFSSDYNLFDTGTSGTMALWGNRDFAGIEEWFYELGLDRHSLEGNPQFIDLAGADDILGYDTEQGVDGGTDDDFRLLADSLGINAGVSSDYYLEEPLPHGHRINLGAYGNTPQATSGPQQSIHVLEPAGLEKVTSGAETWITWQTSGLTAEQPVALINVGGSAQEHWSTDRYMLPTSHPALLPTNTASSGNLVDPAPEEVYHSYRYGEQIQYHLPVADGQYTIRLHFLEPSVSATLGPRAFDVVLQGETVWEDYDIQEQGGERRRAIAESFTLTASDDQGIRLELNSKTDLPAVLSAIELLQSNPNGTAAPTVELDLSFDSGTTWTTLASNVPLDHHGRGRYVWTPAGYTDANTTLVRVRSNDGGRPVGTSLRPFQIAPAGNAYYVNDGDLSDDVFTTAAGNNHNSGKSFDKPMANLAALLQAYSVGFGDTVYVDSGMYTLYREVGLQTQHSGVRILGPPSASAILDRGEAPSSVVMEISDAHDVTIENLTLRGANLGISANRSERLTLNNNTLSNISYTPISVGLGSSHAIIRDNTVDGTTSRLVGQRYGIRILDTHATIMGNTISGFDAVDSVGIDITRSTGAIAKDNTVFGNGIGISTTGHGAVILNNRVYSNVTGIKTTLTAEIIGNSVYDHSGTGIQASGEVRDNVVHSNHRGVDAIGQITANRVYNNTIGISAGRNLQATVTAGNQVYSNLVGIEGHWGTLDNNVIYANTDVGVRLVNADLALLNNTIYQPFGNGVEVTQRGARIYNNILWVDSGIALVVSPDGVHDLQSDFNLFHLGLGTGTRVGSWSGRPRYTLADWQGASGRDRRSLIADPMLADPSGVDGVLGYDAEQGFDGGIDDDFSLQPHSPAIDRGHSWLGAASDRDGKPRRSDEGVADGGSPDYVIRPTSASVFDSAAAGVPQGWRSSGHAWTLNLPFAFTFYNERYTSVRVTSHGYLQFTPWNWQADQQNSTANLVSGIRIAPLWADLRTDGEGNDIFVDQSTSGQITIRWNATHVADGSQANFAVTLFANGQIRFDYGEGNLGLSPTIGISRGDGDRYLLAPYDSADDLSYAPSLLFDLAPGIVDIGAYEFQHDSPGPIPPRAVPDAIYTVLDTTVSFDVMANDHSETGLDRDQIQVLAASSDEVVISVDGDGLLVIQPVAGFTGTVMFQYQVTDVNGVVSQPANSLIHVRANAGQNPREPADVLNSGSASPSDALAVLNAIRLHRASGSGAIDAEMLRDRGVIDDLEGPFYDVSGDGLITPLDALLVLVAIGRQRAEGVTTIAEGEPTDAFWQSAGATPMDWIGPSKDKTQIPVMDEKLLF